MSNTSVKNKAHNSISTLLGTRKQVVCPDCGSKDWRGQVEYITDGLVYEDYVGENGAVAFTVDEGDKSYHCTTYYCPDCGHHED